MRLPEPSSGQQKPAVDQCITTAIVRKPAPILTPATVKKCSKITWTPTAMDLLHGGTDRLVIALWLGHESVETTQMYLDADLALKEQALARTAPLPTHRKRYRPDDQLMAFLKSL